jgi:hypothetical protein
VRGSRRARMIDTSLSRAARSCRRPPNEHLNRLKPLIPRETDRWTALNRGRGSVERAFGRLKHEWGLGPLRVRRIERVRLHADLTILSQLLCVLSRERAVALAA